jgi:hypothetical protein
LLRLLQAISDFEFSNMDFGIKFITPENIDILGLSDLLPTT